ncbi:MAG: transglutaminase family protein [Methanothermobacter sp.]|nr:transglutaminase family protein [Methanothermobacter sp.]
MLGYGGGKISIKRSIYILIACLFILNVGACHAQDNITTNNTQAETKNSYAAAGDAQTSVTTGEVVTAAKKAKYYTEENNAFPSTIQVGKQNVTKEQFTYLMTQALLNINRNGKLTTKISLIKVSPAPTPRGTATGILTKPNYIKLASSVTNFIKTNGKLPNYATTVIGRINPENIAYAMSRILAFYNDYKILPNYVTVKYIQPKNSGSSGSSTNNGKNSDPELNKYLVATANCQVNDPSIQSLATQLTRGLTSTWDKAKAVFNWVRDSISYSFYYNTRYGAVGTLKYRTGNCCDHAHLVVALARAAGIPARYKHGICTFSSGTYGHVWAELYISGKWYSADATSSRNSLGIIKSWNTATGKILGTYASLPF